MIELGIDEAGRGCVLGPMVLAGVWVRDQDEYLLDQWGVNDSKTFGSQESGKKIRSELAQKIETKFKFAIHCVSPSRIDEFVTNGGLNRLEQITAKHILEEGRFDKAVLDGENLFRPLENKSISAMNKADQNFPSVRAASILAKHKRDQELDKLLAPFVEQFGKIQGGGYANKQTFRFVQWYFQRFGDLPPFFRMSYRWKMLDEQLRGGLAE